MLTQTLRSLERDGLVSRTAYDEIPPRVEYALTPLGRSMFTAMDACCEWAAEHLDDLRAAREAYDAS